ncbi:hypothetical protein C0J52_13173 [Blattella germanica]|nr:hypothetical protein C0J52_13173 [Blattella germanica]
MPVSLKGGFAGDSKEVHPDTLMEDIDLDRDALENREKNAIAVDSAGFFSFITYSWISRYMFKAYKKGLTLDDVPQCSPLDSSDLNAQRLELLWQKEVSAKGPRRASFGAVVWRFIRTRIIMSSLVFGLSLIVGFISPAIFMRKLLQYAEDEEGEVMDGVTWAICLTIAEFLRTILFAWNWALNLRTAVRLRSACLALLYRKIIRLGDTGDKSIGELINLFANDGQRIYDVAVFGPMAIGGPIVAVCGVFYILWLLGAWALLGMTVFLVFYPVQYGISRLIGHLRGRTITVSDQRKTAYCQSMSISMAPTVPVISAIVTFLAHICAGNNLTAAQVRLPNNGKLNNGHTLLGKFIHYFNSKLSGMDPKVITSKRNKPLLIKDGYCYHHHSYNKDKSRIYWRCENRSTCNAHCITNVDLQNIIIYKINLAAHLHPPDGAAMQAKEVVQRIKQKASESPNEAPDEAFPLVPFLGNQMKDALSRIREGTRTLYEAVVAFSRIKSILLLEDIRPYITRPIDKTQAVCITGGTFSWAASALHKTKSENGNNHSGPCDVLQNQNKANEQEKEKLNPSDNTDQERPYVLSNINFQASKVRYYEAVYSCSLSQDINMLPGGDQTEIGERGINLSGGQKQRVALARAIYANRDIYLLDDPLSAVDAQVGAHIFEKCILQTLKNKTVILVTHQIQVTLKASNRLHNRLFNKIISSPMQFFEITPVGRVQNLFSKDMDEVDTRLPITVESILQNVWIVMFAILFICLVFPWAVIPLIILGIIYYIISKIFRVAVRDFKRLENVSRSPIFSWVGTTVQGLSTIHAFGKESEFTARFTKLFDENTTCLYLSTIAMRWLAVRIDTLAVGTVCVTSILIIVLHGQVSPALAGLALAYATHISGLFQYTIRLISETEVRFISVERINSYTENVNLRYRKGLPLTLKGISFNIQPGEKIGIVGRTGSGKSSLVTALFRLVEVSSGKIKVDNLDIADVNLEHLRSPILIHLKYMVMQLFGKLWRTLNFVKKFQVWKDSFKHLLEVILVLDEATAAVDPETEVAVQNTIQKEFSHCTVLMIAHRLSTVTNCDRILVMGRGQIKIFINKNRIFIASKYDGKIQ